MGNTINIRKGLDIRLVGEADKVIVQGQMPEIVAIKPTDFVGTRPKALVNVGDEVLAGTPVLMDKHNPAYKVVSPVSGEVVELVRGAKRKLLAIKILADKETRHADGPVVDWQAASQEELCSFLGERGAWAFIRTKPYDAVAFPEIKPKAVFVSAFDTAPLAADVEFLMQGKENDFAVGLEVLAKVSGAKVHLNLHEKLNTHKVFTEAKGVEKHIFSGKHPASSVTVQAHHIDPINRGEFIWYVHPVDVALMGKLCSTGKFDATRLVAVAGPKVKKGKYIRTVLGAQLKHIATDDNLEASTYGNRYISGNVLTGDKEGPEGYLGMFHHQVTVLAEGKEKEFFGWAGPGFNKFSVSRTFFSWLMPGKKYALTTNKNGEERAFVVTGEYEKVFPMDIYPVQLLKAIHTGDIELQEQLGIYEVSPEDFALCEFICTSKIESQQLVRKAHDVLYGELVQSMKEPVH